MDSLGIHLGFLEIQLIAFSLCLPLILSLAALFSLRKQNLRGTALGLWVLIICILPYLGAFAYWIIRPRENGARE